MLIEAAGRRLKEAEEFHRTNAIRPMRIFPEQLAARAHELVLTFRTSMIREVEQAACLKDARAVWSMWPGYLTRPGQERLLRFLESHQIPMLVPIHSFAPERYSEFFERVEPHHGEWWAV